MKKVSVIQNEEDQVPVEVLATSIRAIAAGVKSLRKGPLGEKALLLLISENCWIRKGRLGRGRMVKLHISPSAVKGVLDSLESLQSTYLR